MMPVPGLVSTIIPVYNRAAMLREAVACVLAQDWRPVEIIIVDDGSTDNTLAAAHQIAAAHPEVRVLSQANAGPGVARQSGLEISRGEFVQFLDSDDFLLPHKFSAQIAALHAKPESGIAYGKTYVRNPDGSLGAREHWPNCNAHQKIFPALLANRLWETSTPLYRRTMLDVIGPWPTKRQMEDWEFDAQAGAARIEIVFCDTHVAEYRIHDGHRLAHAWMTDPLAMKHRLAAHARIFDHARTAGIADAAPEMQHFARTLFAMAREGARNGHVGDADALLRLALSVRPAKWDLQLYSCVVKLLGWRLTTSASDFVLKKRRTLHA